jgi:hypothetical protein
LNQELNEDGVPFNEKDAEHLWHDYAVKAGLYAAHIENVHTPMPDHLLLWKGVALFHEVKMQRGNLIYFQHYQWSNLLKMRHSLRPFQLCVIVYSNQVFNVLTVEQVKERGVETAGHGKVKCNVLGLIPQATVSNAFEFDLFLEWVRSHAWKKKQ